MNVQSEVQPIKTLSDHRKQHRKWVPKKQYPGVFSIEQGTIMLSCPPSVVDVSEVNMNYKNAKSLKNTLPDGHSCKNHPLKSEEDLLKFFEDLSETQNYSHLLKELPVTK